MKTVLVICLLGLVLRGGGWYQTSEKIWRSGLTADGEKTEYRLDMRSEESFALLWRVSSEQHYDFFEIEADGEIILRDSGENSSWQYFSGRFPGKQGPHCLVLRYSRDGSGSGGENCAEFFGLHLGEYRENQESGEWKYDVCGGKAVLRKYQGGGGAVVIPGTLSGRSVSGIPGNPFVSGESVSSLVLEDGLMFLGDGALQGLDRIRCLELPFSLHFLGKECFRGCRNLCSVRCRGAFLFAQDGVFMNCASLQEVSQEGVWEDIPSRAFWGCTSLRNLTLPEGVISLGGYAFAGSGLQRLVLPASCGFLEDRAMVNCLGLEAIDVAPGNEFFVAEDGVLLDADRKMLVQYPSGKMDRVWRMPDTVRAIRPYAFYEASNLQRLFMSSALTGLPEHCMQNCRGLTELYLPEALTGIGREALAGCSSLRRLLLPGNLETIAEMAFWGCSQLSVLEFEGGPPCFPEELGMADCLFEVWRGAGWENFPELSGCRLHIRGADPVRIQHEDRSDIFFGQQRLVSFQVPAGVSEIYYTADGGRPVPESGHQYTGPFPVSRSCSLRFRGYADAKPVTMERIIEFIAVNDLPVEEEEAFLISGCGEGECFIEKYLGRRQAFRIPDKIHSCFCRGIAAGAFADCPDLKVLDLPESLLWLELNDLPGAVRMTAASCNLEIIGTIPADRLWFREDFPGKIFLQRGWNLWAFDRTVRLRENTVLKSLKPMVVRNGVCCRPGENIPAGTGVWLWSPEERIIPYVPAETESEMASEMPADQWRLERRKGKKADELLFVWERRMWRKLEWKDDEEQCLGWRIRAD